MKKILVIHPDDRSTDFLKPIYENLPNTTVITGGVSYMNIRQSIIEHDQVMMMGHGSPYGLFSMGKFPNSGGLIIDPITGAMYNLSPDQVNAQMNKGTAFRNNGKDVYVAVALNIDPNWQKVGQLDKVTN